MSNRMLRVIGSLLLMVALVGVSIARPASQAHAASIGQQIDMYASCMGQGVYVSWARVTGFNANGQHKVWPSSGGVFFYPPAINPVTNGWYWVGWTQVEYTLTTGKSGSVWVNVPRNFPVNTYVVSLPC